MAPSVKSMVLPGGTTLSELDATYATMLATVPVDVVPVDVTL